MKHIVRVPILPALGIPSLFAVLLAWAAPAIAVLVPIENITQLSAGGYKTCALNDLGDVLCWGSNQTGDLGTGAPGAVRLPQQINGFPGPMVAISAEFDHQCAIDSSGSVWCWGANDFGQLGDGTFVDRNTPAPVNGLGSAAVAVELGDRHSCAITVGGAMACWGRNADGELGDGTTINRSTPVFASGLPASVVSISTAKQHTCAVTSAEAAWCWGDNAHGQIGDGTLIDRLLPQPVSGLGSGVARIATGARHSCAMMQNGTARCWGDNSFGQLGDATTVDRLVPVQVSGFGSGTDISAGEYFTCARHSDGRIDCWGSNIFGAAGDGSFTDRSTPVQVSGPSDYLSVHAGRAHACGRRSAGQIYCWGDGQAGALGNAALPYISQPVSVPGVGSSGRQLALGYQHSCMRSSNGVVRCWGANAYGQVGDGTHQQRLLPVAVTGAGADVAMIEAGNFGTCAISVPNSAGHPDGLPSGSLSCWGRNYSGELGSGTNGLQPFPVTSLTAGSNVLSVGMGRDHTCISYGGMGVQACTGANYYGQSCRNATSASTVYLDCEVSALNAIATDAGGEHTCGVTAAGGVHCWGENSYGQLGNGTTIDSTSAVTPIGLTSGQIQVVTFDNSSCALSAAGAVSCWGANFTGQLGDGTTISRIAPVAVVGLQSGIVQLAAGGAGACARTSDGAVLCWGSNFSGQLGDGTFTTRLTPVQVIGLNSGVQHIAAGDSHRCALRGGALSCWGSNAFGQFGIGEAAILARPIPVLTESPEPPFERFADGFEDAP